MIQVCPNVGHIRQRYDVLPTYPDFVIEASSSDHFKYIHEILSYFEGSYCSRRDLFCPARRGVHDSEMHRRRLLCKDSVLFWTCVVNKLLLLLYQGWIQEFLKVSQYREKKRYSADIRGGGRYVRPIPPNPPLYMCAHTKYLVY